LFVSNLKTISYICYSCVIKYITLRNLFGFSLLTLFLIILRDFLKVNQIFFFLDHSLVSEHQSNYFNTSIANAFPNNQPHKTVSNQLSIDQVQPSNNILKMLSLHFSSHNYDLLCWPLTGKNHSIVPKDL